MKISRTVGQIGKSPNASLQPAERAYTTSK